MRRCSIRALWILNNHDLVIFSRRFPVVEKQWRVNVATQGSEEKLLSAVSPSFPSDSEVADAFVERKRREGSARGLGIRTTESVEGSDSWVDDPITRHIISLNIKREAETYLLWPLILHIKGQLCILILPLVDPKHLAAYKALLSRTDCGTAIGVDQRLSSLLLNLPSITGACMLAFTIGEIITGDIVEPEVVVSTSPSVGGLLDSITGGIGISSIASRAKVVPASVQVSTTDGSTTSGLTASDGPKVGSRILDKDALRSLITSLMPFGTILDLSHINISTVRTYGFSASDVSPSDVKQPSWKPYLYKGKQRLLFTIDETIHAAMYDRDEMPDHISITGQVNCRAELEGLPDISFPLTAVNASRVHSLSFHPCAQVPDQAGDKQAVMFSPPTGNFVLFHYQGTCFTGSPIKGFYQLSMVSENEGAFLFKLIVMEGYKSPLTMEFCTVTMPFPRRRLISFNGTPSVGTVSTSEHLVEWKIIPSGRGVTGKSIEATFSGTIKFASLQTRRLLSFGSQFGGVADEDSDSETETSTNVNVDDFLLEKLNKDLPPIDLDEPFYWQAYDYAKVSFKVTGASISGMSIDTKSVSIYPSVRAAAESTFQVSSGNYILWNTLGKCPYAATAEVSI